MNSPSEIPGDEVGLSQRQLILAQIELMAAEDARDDARSRLAEMEKLVLDAQAEAQTCLAEMAQVIEARNNATDWAKNLERKIASLATELAERERALRTIDEAFAALSSKHEELTRTQQLLADRIGRMERSVSWRITAPWRFVVRLFSQPRT